MHNLVELDLCVTNLSGVDENYELPKSLFKCKTLVVLKLRSHIIINTPDDSWCLPRLKVLFIETDPVNNLMEKLLDGCPALEVLAVTGHVRVEDLDFNISALELKKLTIHLVTRYRLDEYVGLLNLNVSVRAPKLEYFHLQQSVLSSFVLENSKSLVKATIDLTHHGAAKHPTFASRATALLAQICHVKSLSLSSHNLDEICDLPIFGNLNQLKLHLHRCCSWWLELLKRSPNLESLVIEHVGHNCRGPVYFVKHVKPLWHPPELVPNCLLSHVKTICIIGFGGKDDEFKIAKYLLKNGEVLNSMKIYTDGDLCAKKLEKLSMFERGSKTCKVDIWQRFRNKKN
uniref:F-box/LRR-repeat protein At4g14096-like n=1 Tax=Fragaria vesca subsp. vesca TaxID=101020 RepID=UPI0005C88066|nr:PREDICTED: F-box/LRR-repeat protein At4g14096-like [Fragaria vesca subsp. vesca]XP_011461338.1 PREDICTED: F-box/LRR-repeat protein At4g14096-like [Fragaria vesca subsp. vesca]XP_011461340.1 PREDICTED: F-box/LRR-repeat protein At4g14096-like [Fragaria vesca subsp. vesca]XP_011461343.1 PREDICTED: F-box/LRR-repeat protein At4g14096-like [Fragaria vesca subsp. vesca]XP_011461345.1 PREDICTED: F-box/LRR-repeat protein At4g14096-like [Fragaria vesca subsp. vesca]